jgi:hypothetical protein
MIFHDIPFKSAMAEKRYLNCYELFPVGENEKLYPADEKPWS